MTKPPGIVADGAQRYLAALEAEAASKLRELQAMLECERELPRRIELEREMTAIREALAEKRRNSVKSLF